MADYEAPRPAGYSLPQIGLHWLIVLLVFYQLIFGEDMGAAERVLRRGEPLEGATLLGANLHLWVGIAILVLAAVRLVVRLGYGAPAPVPGLPAWQEKLSGALHWGFYALLFLVPISGLLAWFVAPELGDVHSLAKPLFIVLILVHAGAALYHHFVRKDEVLKRMLVPNG